MAVNVASSEARTQGIFLQWWLHIDLCLARHIYKAPLETTVTQERDLGLFQGFPMKAQV